MSEHDANQWLLESAAMRDLDVVDPLEQTQTMRVAERRGRMHEGRQLQIDERNREWLQGQTRK